MVVQTYDIIDWKSCESYSTSNNNNNSCNKNNHGTTNNNNRSNDKPSCVYASTKTVRVSRGAEGGGDRVSRAEGGGDRVSRAEGGGDRGTKVSDESNESNRMFPSLFYEGEKNFPLALWGGGQYCRKSDMLPKILSAVIFRPVKFKIFQIIIELLLKHEEIRNR